MKHSTGKPTKAERARLERLAGMLCVACCIYGKPTCHKVEIHHLLSGNKRRGHLFTIPLCSWHHRGDPWTDCTARYMEANYGPSLARSSKAFHEKFGTDEELLKHVNEWLGER